ncbi:MAG: phosphoribosylformylglycinamidine synthase, partial [Cyanobacteria bacterium P01_A01_bin.17]
MLYLRGSQALSTFRIKQLLRDIQDLVPEVTGLVAEYQHIAQLESGVESLSEDEQQKLASLLAYGALSSEDELVEPSYHVLPRVGTISPWSTKATEILKLCGLNKVKRVERIVSYSVQHEGISAEQISLISKLTHDPMTESVVFALADANALFDSQAPAALSEIELLNDGVSAIIDANLTLGLALSDDEVEYLADQYTQLNKNPTDVEL